MPIDTPPKVTTTEKFVPPELIAGDESSLVAFKEWLRQNFPEMPDNLRDKLQAIIDSHIGILGADTKSLSADEVELFKGAMNDTALQTGTKLQPIAPALVASKPTGRSRVKPSGASSKPTVAPILDTPVIQKDPKVAPSSEVKILESVDFKKGISPENLNGLLELLDTLVIERRNLRKNETALSEKEANAQSPAYKAVRSEIIKLRNRLIKQKGGEVVNKKEMTEIQESLLANLITYKTEIEGLKNVPPPPSPDVPDPKTPEQLAYETARGDWSRSKKEMTTAEVSRFSPEYAQLKKEIQNFNTKGMPTDVAEKAELRHLDMKQKVESIERRYLEAKTIYASSLEKVIATSKSPEEKAKLQSLIVARFFAKTGEERYQNSFEHSTKSVAERTANRASYHSYREREISLNEEILSEKKKNLFGKLKGVWGKVPPSIKMGIGGAAIGIAVAGGGWVPVIGAIGASIATKASVNFAGNRFFGKRQERKNDQTRLQGIASTRASDFASLESSLEKGDKNLRNIKTAITVGGYAAGAIAAKFTAGALTGVSVDDVRNFVGERFGVAPEQIVPTPTTPEVGISNNSFIDESQEIMTVLREEVIEKLDECITALQNELQDVFNQDTSQFDTGMVELPSLNRGAPEFVPHQHNVGTLTAESFNPDGTSKPGADNSVLTTETVAEVFDLPTHIYSVIEGDPGVSYELKELYPEIFGEYTKDQWVSFIDSVNNNPELLKASGIESGNLGLIHDGNTVRTDLLAEFAVAPDAKTYLADTTLPLETSIRPLARPEDLSTSNLAPEESIRPQARPDELVPSELAPSESIRPMARPEGLGIVDPAILDSQFEAVNALMTPETIDQIPDNVLAEMFGRESFIANSYQDILGSDITLPESLQDQQLIELAQWAKANEIADLAQIEARFDVMVQRDLLPAIALSDAYSLLNAEHNTQYFIEAMSKPIDGGSSWYEQVLQKNYGDATNLLNEESDLSLVVKPMIEGLADKISGSEFMTVGEILEKAIVDGSLQVIDGKLVEATV